MLWLLNKTLTILVLGIGAILIFRFVGTVAVVLTGLLCLAVILAAPVFQRDGSRLGPQVWTKS
jgi:hypothetical protein